VAELALVILNKLTSTSSTASLETDIVDLCGLEWLDDISTMIIHRKELAASFVVSLNLYSKLHIFLPD